MPDEGSNVSQNIVHLIVGEFSNSNKFLCVPKDLTLILIIIISVIDRMTQFVITLK